MIAMITSTINNKKTLENGPLEGERGALREERPHLRREAPGRFQGPAFCVERSPSLASSGGASRRYACS
jgi:hypothetical protein